MEYSSSAFIEKASVSKLGIIDKKYLRHQYNDAKVVHEDESRLSIHATGIDAAKKQWIRRMWGLMILMVLSWEHRMLQGIIHR